MSNSSVHRPCAAACSAVKQLLLAWCLCLFLYRTDRPIVGCHLAGRGCGWTRSCVLGANARFQFETGYDSEGNGLTRRAGHMPMVGEREAICNTPRPRAAGGSQNARLLAVCDPLSCEHLSSCRDAGRLCSGCCWLVSLALLHPRLRLCAHLPDQAEINMTSSATSLAGVRDDAISCAWGQSSVSNRV